MPDMAGTSGMSGAHEERIMSRRTHGVTVRELGRHAAALLDEVERTRQGIVVPRYGRGAAFLGPLPEDYEPANFERTHVAPRFQDMAPLVDRSPEAEVSDEEIAELGEQERFMLREIVAAAPHWWMPRSTEEVRLSSPRFRLEERGLIESRAGGGWKATARGITAASRT